MSTSTHKICLSAKSQNLLLSSDLLCYLGPIVQSIVSLTSLLMTNSLTVVGKAFSNTLIFLLQKCDAKAAHIFSAKNIYVFAIFQDRNFNITLANNFIKF